MRSEGNAPKNGKTNSWFLLHDNAPAHQSVLAKDFLAKNNVTTLQHPPYSPDLGETDFYLFPLLKSALKRRHSCYTTDNIKNATEELKRLSQNGFQKCFQQLYSRW
jgi:transposase